MWPTWRSLYIRRLARNLIFIPVSLWGSECYLTHSKGGCYVVLFIDQKGNRFSLEFGCVYTFKFSYMKACAPQTISTQFIAIASHFITISYIFNSVYVSSWFIITQLLQTYPYIMVLKWHNSFHTIPSGNQNNVIFP